MDSQGSASCFRTYINSFMSLIEPAMGIIIHVESIKVDLVTYYNCYIAHLILFVYMLYAILYIIIIDWRYKNPTMLDHTENQPC